MLSILSDGTKRREPTACPLQVMTTGLEATVAKADGHFGAARRGWEDRDDNRGGRSSQGRGGGSSPYDDDDDRGGNRGRGGWFGDSEGHLEAARRGRNDR